MNEQTQAPAEDQIQTDDKVLAQEERGDLLSRVVDAKFSFGERSEAEPDGEGGEAGAKVGEAAEEAAEVQSVKIGEDEVPVEELAASRELVQSLQAEAGLADLAELLGAEVGLVDLVRSGKDYAVALNAMQTKAGAEEVCGRFLAAYMSMHPGPDDDEVTADDLEEALRMAVEDLPVEARVFRVAAMRLDRQVAELNAVIAKLADEAKEGVAAKSAEARFNEQVLLVRAALPGTEVSAEELRKAMAEQKESDPVKAWKLHTYHKPGGKQDVKEAPKTPVRKGPGDKTFDSRDQGMTAAKIARLMRMGYQDVAE